MGYSKEVKQAIIEAGIEAGENEYCNVMDLARLIGFKYNVKYGAVSDRIRNVIFHVTQGKRGRNTDFEPSWVRPELNAVFIINT